MTLVNDGIPLVRRPTSIGGPLAASIDFSVSIYLHNAPRSIPPSTVSRQRPVLFLSALVGPSSPPPSSLPSVAALLRGAERAAVARAAAARAATRARRRLSKISSPPGARAPPPRASGSRAAASQLVERATRTALVALNPAAARRLVSEHAAPLQRWGSYGGARRKTFSNESCDPDPKERDGGSNAEGDAKRDGEEPGAHPCNSWQRRCELPARATEGGSDSAESSGGDDSGAESARGLLEGHEREARRIGSAAEWVHG